MLSREFLEDLVYLGIHVANKFVLLHHGGGRPGPFYHIVHVSVYLGRQGEEGSLIEHSELQ